MSGPVIGRQVGVGCRIPLVCVHAIHNAVEYVLTTPEKPVKSKAPFPSRDLICIPLRDCEDAVAGDQSPFERVDGESLVQLVLAHVLGEYPLYGAVPLVRKTQPGEDCGFLRAMVGHIVNCENGARFLIDFVWPVLGGDEHGHQGGVPIVGHKDYLVSIHKASELELQRHLASNQTQQREPKEVVSVRSLLVAIWATFTMVRGVVNEHKVHSVSVLVVQATFHKFPKQPHCDVLARVRGSLVQRVGLAVQIAGGDDHHPVTSLSKCRG
mmetsp:Transcript_32629/g.45282  ORF Transcript_32629/g.45282 Transcript_32629/m.45282 type:complete len:268 (-) Transcript_32629:695-1498(-)